MPLVVPGINSNMGDKSEWANKLMGKKISEGGSDEVVRLLIRKNVPRKNEKNDCAFFKIVVCEERPS